MNKLTRDIKFHMRIGGAQLFIVQLYLLLAGKIFMALLVSYTVDQYYRVCAATACSRTINHGLPDYCSAHPVSRAATGLTIASWPAEIEPLMVLQVCLPSRLRPTVHP